MQFFASHEQLIVSCITLMTTGIMLAHFPTHPFNRETGTRQRKACATTPPQTPLPTAPHFLQGRRFTRTTVACIHISPCKVNKERNCATFARQLLQRSVTKELSCNSRNTVQGAANEKDNTDWFPNEQHIWHIQFWPNQPNCYAWLRHHYHYAQSLLLLCNTCFNTRAHSKGLLSDFL